MRAKSYVVIVDAFSTGALLAPIFKQLGYSLLHVQTSNYFSLRFTRSFLSTDFEYCLDYESLGLKNILDFLSQLPIVCVLPGLDSGVLLADELALHLNVAKNNLEKSVSRVSKFFMHEALRMDGLLSAHQIKSTSIEEVLAWYSQQAFQKIVVKPEYSALSEGVSFCTNQEDIIRAFQTTIGTRNVYGCINNALVVQEYMYGEEYIVNTMSVEGEHFITDIWVGVDEDEEKISADLYARLLYPEEEQYTVLSHYLKQVLDCVGIKTGPAHVEVRCTPIGPVLIEINPRLAGALSPKAFKYATGFNPVELTVDAYVNPERALQALRQNRTLRHARFVYFNSDLSGLIVQQPDLSKIYSLQSVQDVLLIVRKGDFLYKTSDITGRPGYAYLVNDDLALLDKDYQRFLVLEKELYRAMLSE